MAFDAAVLAAGCFCAFIGGELFLRGMLGLAAWWRLPAGLVAATLGAFATSSPEFFVAVSASMEGKPDIALGDVMGSSLVNIALVLGLPLTIMGMPQGGARAGLHHVFALLFFPLLALLLSDGTLGTSDALILITLFACWLLLATRSATPDEPSEDTPASGGPRDLAVAGVGLLMLFLAGQLIVAGAVSIASDLGVSGFLIGVTIVALGTSVPELATVIVSMARGHHDVGLNTALGSNVFNGLFILPAAALISPISVLPEQVVPVLVAAALATILIVPIAGRQLERWRGAVLLALYAAFVALSLRS